MNFHQTTEIVYDIGEFAWDDSTTLFRSTISDFKHEFPSVRLQITLEVKIRPTHISRPFLIKQVSDWKLFLNLK